MRNETTDTRVTQLTDTQIDAFPQSENHKDVLRMMRAHQQVTSKAGWTNDEARKAVKASRSLFMDNNGQVACAAHVGHGPQWVRLTAEEVKGFAGLFGCEVCAS